jgi:gamma-glutamyltranspeptidase/glutathione hydrolase
VRHRSLAPVSILVAAWLLAAPASGVRQAGVATGEAAATRVALDLLGAGGNAVDAAVGAALALAVVFPEAGNLGGGGFAVVRLGDELAALDFREVAPAAARPTMYLDPHGEPRPNASTRGPLAAGVPGAPAGYHELHRRFGVLPWASVVTPAATLARDGFAVSWQTARSLANHRDGLALYSETAAVWLPGGLPPGAGEVVRLPDLARTLDRYAESGPPAITAGPVAAAVEATSRRHGGLLTAADLAAYRPVWREPLRFERFGWSFAAMPLPSSGGSILAEVFGLLERRGYLALPRGSAARAHLLIEALRRSFADRFLLGDPAGSTTTLEALLDPARLDRLARELPENAARSSVLAPGARGAEPSDTTHISVIDGEGNLVALTTTINDLFGCKLWVPEAGFFLNDEMDDFATAPGRPNSYGLVHGEANRIVPGRRPLSSMSPTLGWRGIERLVAGGRGGSTIPPAVAQALLALWDGDAPAAAVARPRLHHQWLPDRVELEPGALAGPARDELAARGHELVVAPSRAKVNVVRRDAAGGIEAGGDPRGFEHAAVVDLPDREEKP